MVSKGRIQPTAYEQARVFEAATLFLKAEGILPAPESFQAIASVMDEALSAKKERKERVILFNLSGHGFLDISVFNGIRDAEKA